MEKVYYYRNSKAIAPEYFDEPELQVIKKTPSFFVAGMKNMNIGRKRLLFHMFFTFLFRGFHRTFVEYDLCRNGRIISKAVLISKVPIYDFLPYKGIHLGYCETIEEERGHGYYPRLLRYICCDNPNKDLHMIVSVTNISSIRGIEKAGLIRYGVGYKTAQGKFKLSTLI